MEVQKQLIPFSPQKRSGIKMTPRWLTVHSTGNPGSTAQNERDNLARPGNIRQASFHIVVDEKCAIECIPFHEVAWHAGDGRGNGNMASISMEICESGNRKKTLGNAAEVAAQILIQHEMTIEDMVQHFHWSGKNCPRILREGKKWEAWVNQVKEKMGEMEGEDLAKIIPVSVKLPSGEIFRANGILQEGTNYVAMRQVLEKLGFKVGWDGKNITLNR